jgi:hypothetical protein
MNEFESRVSAGDLDLGAVGDYAVLILRSGYRMEVSFA